MTNIDVAQEKYAEMGVMIDLNERYGSNISNISTFALDDKNVL